MKGLYDLKCPYCGKEIDLDFTDDWNEIYSEDTMQKECPECEKILNVIPHINIDFDVEECKCQLENHEWKPTNTDPKAWTVMECVHCGERRAPTDEEREKYGIPSKKEYLESLKEK